MGSDPVTVLVTRDAGVLALAQSLLESAELDFVTKGEHLQNIPGQIVWMEVQVRAEDAAEAKTLLSDLEPQTPSPKPQTPSSKPRAL
jgi:hypothetical protein